MPDTLKMQGSFNETSINTGFTQEGLMTESFDPLSLSIPDDELVDIIDDYEDGYDSFYKEKYDLFNRRKKNEVYYFGRQLIQAETEKSMKSYESRYQDNVLYEIMGTIKPLGMSRVPDLMATPGNDSQESVLIAQEMSKALDTEIKEQSNRFILGLAYKHLPVYFGSWIKAWWDNEMDDYKYGVIHPDLMKCDWTCSTHNVDDMKWTTQKVPLIVQEVGLRFPNTKQKFYAQLEKDGIMPGKKETWNALATMVKISEVWFHEYRSVDGGKVERIDGLVWKYKDVILRKMKNPNFDYEGETRYFAYDQPGDEKTKRGLNPDELNQILMTGQLPENVKEQKVYHNYFRFPRKPFYLMGYDQWGRQPYDETSWIEQNLQNQKSLDKRGKQIEETLDNRGHHIFSKGAMTPADVEELDLSAPNMDLSVEGSPRDVHDFIPPERPTTQEFEEIGNLRSRMYAIAHSTAVRGEIKANAPATSNQIAREGDFTAADDCVEDTINPAAQWMADWAMQFIKLRYTKDHFRWIMGIAGDMVFQKLNRNMILDGMIIKIKASGTDKLRAQNNAMDMAKMQMTDPYTFFVDMGLSDPEGRTEKLILAKTDPMSYLKKVVKGLDSSQALAQALMNAELPSQPAEQQMQPPVAPPTMPGSPGALQPGGTQNPTPTNTSQIPEIPINQPQGQL
jgi:hypothetical protein